jgi:hypothetical protein
VSITEQNDAAGTPRTITIESRDRRLPITMQLTVNESVRTPLGLTRGAGGTTTFLQLGGDYRVTGRAADVDLNFTARGSAETFRAGRAEFLTPESPRSGVPKSSISRVP